MTNNNDSAKADLLAKIHATLDLAERGEIVGSTEDENPDPRLVEVMNNLLILEVFYHDEYLKIVKERMTTDSTNAKGA